MGQEVYIHPPPPPRCKPRDKTPRKYLGFGSRALSPARYEREREREREDPPPGGRMERGGFPFMIQSTKLKRARNDAA